MGSEHAHGAEYSSTVDAAAEAMRHWRSAAATGGWAGLLAVMDPDVTFHVPVEGFAGVRHGAAAAAQFFDHLTGAVRADLEVTSTLRGGDRTAFEVSVRGEWLGRPFTQRLCLVFVVADGLVR